MTSLAILLIPAGCRQPEMGAGAGTGLRDHAMQLMTLLKSGDWKGIKEERNVLLQSGAEGVPWFFWAAVQMLPEPGFSLMCRWNDWARELRELGLNEDYAAMFPLDPWTCQIPENILLREGYYVWIGEFGPSTCIYNPVKGYERLRGKGTWPAAVDLTCVVGECDVTKAEDAECELEWLRTCASLLSEDIAGADQCHRVLNQEESRVRSKFRMMDGSTQSEDESDILYDKDGALVGMLVGDTRLLHFDHIVAYGSSLRPMYLDYLLKAGPAVLPIVFNHWVEERNRRFIWVWDYWLRKAVGFGYWRDCSSIRKALRISQDEALCRGLLIDVSRPENSHGKGDGIRNGEDRDRDGRLLILNPIPAYEEVFGVGSWPAEIPVERIVAPERWAQQEKR